MNKQNDWKKEYFAPLTAEAALMGQQGTAAARLADLRNAIVLAACEYVNAKLTEGHAPRATDWVKAYTAMNDAEDRLDSAVEAFQEVITAMEASDAE